MKRVTKIFKEPSIYAESSLGEFIKFFIGSIIASIVAFLILTLFPSIQINQQSINFLVPLLLGSFISFLAFSSLWYRENKTAFTYLHNIRSSGKNLIDAKQRKITQNVLSEFNELLYSIVKLQYEQVQSTYTNQIKIASIFNKLSKNSFFATSFDLPSHFYYKNESYLNSMDTSYSITGHNEKGIPNKTRIFICSLDEFIEDIYLHPESLIRLIKWHLNWHKKSGTGLENTPIRFYLYQNMSEKEKLNEFFDGLDKDNVIPDFMIVDSSLVYGRIEKNTIKDDKVSLRAIFLDTFYIPGIESKLQKQDKSLIDKYNEIFTNIYNNSLEPKNIIELLDNQLDKYKNEMKKILKDITLKKDDKQMLAHLYKFSPMDLGYKKNLLKNEIDDTIKNYNNTQDRINHYGHIFEDNTKGQKFTNTWLNLMKESKYTCIALDTADLRQGKTRFLDKWKEDKLYKDFLAANVEAVRKNDTKIKRIFILDEKIPNEDQWAFHGFLKDCIDFYKLSVGIVLIDDLTSSNIINDRELQLSSDFILLNVEDDLSNTEEVYGFKVSKSDTFEARSLSFSDNLIIPDEFEKFYNLFNEINNKCVHFDNSTDYDSEKIKQFIEEVD